MNGPVASLFRVRLEFLKAREVRDRPAVTGTFHMTLYVAASDAETAAAAARRALSERNGFVPERARVVSVKFVERVNVLATPQVYSSSLS